jgi:2-polyprenyl-3-methyl-5-hydroxy-6-metoxy-1,4-benzoquinol methylase
MRLLGDVEQGIVPDCREGGGVGYEQFPRFEQLMAESSALTNDAALIDVTLPLVPGLPERLQAGILVADIGCGCGHALNLMARAFPASRFTGMDFAPEGIATAEVEAHDSGLANARFQVQDVARLDAPAQFDFITAFDSIHDQAYPRQVLQAISQGLRPGGVFLMVDIRASSYVQENIEHPLGPFLYMISCMHCMSVSLAQGGEGLGAVWGEQLATELLHEAGFTQVEIQHQSTDVTNNYYICTKS